MKILFSLLLFIVLLVAENNMSVESNLTQETLSTDMQNISSEVYDENDGIYQNEYTYDINQTNETNETNETLLQINDVKILYMHYDEVPQRVIKGEIFSVTIRVLSTESDFYELNYIFENSVGLKLLNELPFREERGKFYYDTFHFLAQSTGAILPDFKAYITSFDGTEYRPTILIGKKITVVALNPRKNFSNIVANGFALEEYKTTSYDSNHNIVVFVATAKHTIISSFHLNNVYKQRIESSTNDIEESKLTYFAVIQKEIENFQFSYFNLLSNKFEIINIPIVVNDDSVTTQTDLKPKDQSKEQLKMLGAIAVSLVMLMLIVWSRKYIYSLALIFPITYAMYTYTPAKEVCIRPNSNIYLLPVKNGTIFETTQGVTYLMEEGNIVGHTKVKLQNNKIGWVKHENLCSY